MAGHGGKRPGAGRKPGSRNRKTEEQVKAVEETGMTPLEYLLSVMRADFPPELQEKIESGEFDAKTARSLADWYDKRIEAAKAAAPYVHPKLSSVEFNGSIGHTHEDALSELE